MVNNSPIGRGAPLILCGVFSVIVINNFAGLLPYVFTASRHIRFTLPLSLCLWLSLIVYALSKTFSSFIAHLVPKGTPKVLIPFIVLIEIIRSIIRPFTLAIRLAANMIAGHLLLVLISSPAPFLDNWAISFVVLRVVLLSLLEVGVSVIQGYVFIRLSSLYLREVNNNSML